MTGELVLEAGGIIKRYGPRTVVDAERFAVGRGESWAILGPNGAGKSTFCRILALLEDPDQGWIRLFGHEGGPTDTVDRRRTAMVFQRPILFQGKVRSNVELGLRFRGMKRAQRAEAVDRALALMGATSLGEADVRTLSGGELQRVALARALVLEPEIIFLDEPTSNLDVALRRQFREDLRSAVARVSATVILVTHDLTEGLQLATHLAVMVEGRLMQQGTVAQVMDQPRHVTVARYVGMETFWEGRVGRCETGVCRVDTASGAAVWARPSLSVGRRVLVAIRPEDVLLHERDGGLQALSGADGISGLNVWAAEVAAITPVGTGERVRLRLEGPHGHVDPSLDLAAVVSRPTARGLRLELGRRVTASIHPGSVALIDAAEEPRV